MTLLFFSWAQLGAVLAAVDHAPLAPGHIDVAEVFIARHLKAGPNYSVAKVKQFIEKLKNDVDRLKRDIYETRVIEGVELDINSVNHAKRRAKKGSKKSKDKMLRGYREYLIPKMEKLLQLLIVGASQVEFDAVVDAFVRGYIPYYVPNAFRNQWPRDGSIPYAIAHLFKYHRFKKQDNKLGANNLQVGPMNLESIQTCLGANVEVGSYLEESQLQQLRRCGFDLSLLNPGISALWSPVEAQSARQLLNINEDWFPKEGEKIHYQKVNFRGHTSPKVKVYYLRNGVEQKVKLKLGQEVHSDIAVSRLFELVGLNQDKMQYKPFVKVELGKKSFQHLKSMFVNKYGLENFNRHLHSWGGEAGRQWVIFKDALFETRANKELRVSPFDISSWDLGNRREYRSLLLLWAWVGLHNMKPANLKFIYRQTDDGFEPLLRIQDVGSSLGAHIHLRKLNQGFSMFQYGRVNNFPSRFIKSNRKKDEVKIDWDDFASYKRYFSYTTWDDLKWMARKIAAVSKNDMKLALEGSGMPEAVAHLYLIKLVTRRNEMVRAFGLESEYPLIQVPQLKRYNPPKFKGQIVNGKLQKKVFEGKNTLVEVQNKWATILPSILWFKLPITEWEEKETGHKFSTILDGLQGIQAKIGVSEESAATAITKLPIGVGAQAILTRVVTPNPEVVNDGKKMNLYRITDSIRLRFALDSPILKRAVKKIDYLKVDAGARFFEWEMQYIHYDDEVKQAYLKDFRIPKILKDIPKFAAYHLKPMELLRFYKKIGVDGELGAGIYAYKPLFKNEVGVSGGSYRIMSHYIVRDQFNRIHYFSDQSKNRNGIFNFQVADIGVPLAQLPLIALGLGRAKFQVQISDKILPSREGLVVEGHKPSVAQKHFERKEIARILDADGPQSEVFDLSFEITARGKNSNKRRGAFYLINKDVQKSYAMSKVKLADGSQRRFYRVGLDKSKYLGIRTPGIPTYDLLTKRRNRTRIAAEIDLDHKDQSVIAIRTEDYYKFRDKKSLETMIAGLNLLYSKKPETPFYRNFDLPSVDEVDKYYKIYGQTRIFLNGEDFADSLLKLSDAQLSSHLKKHFSGIYSLDEHAGLSKRMNFTQRNKVRLLVGKLLRTRRKIEKQLKHGYVNSSRDCQDLIVKFIEQLRIGRHGLGFLRSTLKKDSIFVMGDIAGVHLSYSGLQDLQQLQRRRFAGESWGKFNATPPLQKLLRYQRAVGPSVHIQKTISDDYIFGILETALPANIEPLFGHQTKF